MRLHDDYLIFMDPTLPQNITGITLRSVCFSFTFYFWLRSSMTNLSLGGLCRESI